MVSNKKYTIHTIGQVITFYSNQVPQYTERRIIFVKLSGNEITFERCNVICVDEQTVADNTEGATTD